MSSPQYQQMPPMGIMPQQQRPQGFGGPNPGASIQIPQPQFNPNPQPQYQGHMQSQFGMQPHPQQYGGYVQQINPLTRLISYIPLNQTLNGMAPQNGDIGFNAYSYQREQPRQQTVQQSSGFFGELPRQMQQVPQGMSQEQMAEQYRLQVRDYAAKVSNRIFEQLHNKMNKPGETARQVLESFITTTYGHADPIVVEYINEIQNNIQLYRYCCAYACVIMTALVSEHAMSAGLEGVERDEKLLASMLTDSFTTIVALQFTEWLEKHPRSLLMANRLTPRTIANIENLDVKMTDIERIILSVGGTQNPIAFPWRAGVLGRIRQSCEAGAVSYDFYTMYNQEENAPTIGGFTSMDYGNAQGNFQEAHINRNPEWYQDYKKKLFEETQPVRNDVDQFGDPIGVCPVNSNWAETKEIEESIIKNAKKYESLSPRERKAAELSDFPNMHLNKDEWFIPVPGTENECTIDPKYFKHLAKRFKAIDQIGYEHNDHDHKSFLPLVKFSDNNKEHYSYRLVYHPRCETEYLLKNPDKILELKRETKKQVELKIKTLNSKTKTLENIFANKDIPHNDVLVVSGMEDKAVRIAKLEQGIKQLESIEKTVLKTTAKPKFVYEKIQLITQMRVGLGREFDAFIIGFSQLVTGRQKKGSVKYLIDSVKHVLRELGEDEFEKYARISLTNTINRWLVESCGFRNKNGGSVYVDDIFEDVVELEHWLENNNHIDALKKYRNMELDPFFTDNIGFLPSSEIYTEHKKLIKSKTDFNAGIDEKVFENDFSFSPLINKNYIFATASEEDDFLDPNKAFITVSEDQSAKLSYLNDKAEELANASQVVLVQKVAKGSVLWLSTYSTSKKEYTLTHMQQGLPR